MAVSISTLGTVSAGGPVLTVQWSFTDSVLGDDQAWYRVRLTNDAGTVTYYDSGWLQGDNTSHTIDVDANGIPHATTDITARVDARGRDMLFIADQGSPGGTETGKRLDLLGNFIEAITIGHGEVYDMVWDGTQLWVLGDSDFGGSSPVMFRHSLDGTQLGTEDASALIAVGGGAVAYDGEAFWFGQNPSFEDGEGTVARYTYDGDFHLTGPVLKPGLNTLGALTWDGTHLWALHSAGEFFEMELARFDPEGNVVLRVPAPFDDEPSIGSARAICWTGSVILVVCDHNADTTRTAFVVHPLTGAVMGRITLEVTGAGSETAVEAIEFVRPSDLVDTEPFAISWGTPHCTITAPLDGAVFTELTGLEVEWQFSDDDGGNSQAQWRVRLLTEAGLQVEHDTGWVSGSETSYEIPVVLRDGSEYRVEVQLKNNHGIRTD